MGLKGEGEEGVEGVDEVFDESPNRGLAWLMRDNKRVSGPQAKPIISFSPVLVLQMKKDNHSRKISYLKVLWIPLESSILVLLAIRTGVTGMVDAKTIERWLTWRNSFAFAMGIRVGGDCGYGQWWSQDSMIGEAKVIEPNQEMDFIRERKYPNRDTRA
ncbi:hypothetical protein TEA_008320 [Camellia sinensis var. sinensis]|uniref:Uncharacterized protein n=1 Tax=Camellia sinensis var. sinensis TaxID=542762 RepID=A0A4S4EU30_CAMSN|nr:hypothetical protein TEA_008320 [Camellia sinensis var. sinensis]